jgi:uncharacterized membrane protein
MKSSQPESEVTRMALALILLLLVLILFGIGIAVKALLIVAAVLAVLWLLGWLAHPTGRRWYYW